MVTTIFWFRNDLRLSDNLALTEAVQASDNLIPVFIFDDSVSRPLGGAQRWWLHHSLVSLRESLKKKGIHLILKKGGSKTVLIELIKKYRADSIYWNWVYEPETMKRDMALLDYFSKQLNVSTFNGSLLTEPSQIKNKSGTYFKVYTPYWKTVKEKIAPKKILSVPRSFSQKSKMVTDRLENWKLLPKKPDWSIGFSIWKPGEKGARHALKRFIYYAVERYANDRDRPALLGTSRLSPYLHFGEISIWQVWNAIKQIETMDASARQGAQVYLKQLIWREFSYYLLFHFQKLDKDNFRPEFNAFKWIKNKKQLRAWQKGLTGYPLVDAGMRELWATGYMHNRVRMVVASFLTKDLFIDWREGEKWFWDTLLDADLANNAMGWQWVAGCGADAAPYFRIFNPTLQAKKFDPNGDYIRQWIPALAKLPKRYIHEPSAAPQFVLEEAQIQLGRDYPHPMVNHKTARDAAMRRYRKL